ncbi:unnamed protein product [Urochloa decumbens]|uniref:Uncharacterized protein n=1 Tax=Urochloa decumbens TaxID=240449 RepID=A0ABC8ZBB1_9POAL
MDQDLRHCLIANPDKVSAFFPAMAAAKTPTPSKPSFFKLLKAGALLPARNRSLFAAVFALAVAYNSLALLVNNLTVKPAADKLLLDAMAFSNNDVTDPTTLSPDDYAQLIKDAWGLARAGAACLLLDATAGSAVWVIALLAAVATCAGETPLSLAALLGSKDKEGLEGLALTMAFVYALQTAYFAVLLAAMAAILANLSSKEPVLLLLLRFYAYSTAASFAYFTFLCALGVVVAAAEPGRRGAGAVARAWRLLKVKGRKRRAALLVAVVVAFAAACSRAHTLAMARALGSPASELLLGFLYAAAVAGVSLFAACAITAFYYECREDDDDVAANTEFVKLATEEMIDV